MLFPTMLIAGFPKKVLLPFTVAPAMFTPENSNSKPLNADPVKVRLPVCPDHSSKIWVSVISMAKLLIFGYSKAAESDIDRRADQTGMCRETESNKTQSHGQGCNLHDS